jgi:hypothetical protein
MCLLAFDGCGPLAEMPAVLLLGKGFWKVGVGLDETKERYVGAALSRARGRLTRGGSVPTGSAIVMECLHEMVSVQRRQRIKYATGPANVRSLWPDFRTEPDERSEAAKQRLIDYAAGDWPNSDQPTPRDVSTMEAVESVFRACLVDRHQDRDWKILNLLAHPKKSLRNVGKGFNRSHVWVRDRRNLQCAAIWKKVFHLMPPAMPLSLVLQAA